MAREAFTYDLTEWQQYRQREQARFAERQQESAAVWDQWDQAEVSASPDDEPAPMPEVDRPEEMEPPVIPATPPAFDRDLMPNLPDDHVQAMTQIEKESSATLTWLKSIRMPYETDWRRNMAYYEMAEELRHRGSREADIEMLSEIDRDAELEPERMAMLLPVIFESVQALLGSDLNTMGGSTTDFCELMGSEKNDVNNSVNVMSFINYQQRTEIATTELLMDFILDARIYGTGWIFQDWNWTDNIRTSFVPSPFEVWCDASSTLADSSVLVLRREMSVAELYTLREKGMVWFSTSDIDKAVKINVTDTLVESQMTGQSSVVASARRDAHRFKEDVNPMYQKIYVDIQMDTEPHRWVMRVNESLIIAVSKPLIPADESLEVEPRFPCAVYAPVRKQRHILGDATVTRMRQSQDFANAMATLMIENVKGSVLGNWTSNDPNMDGRDVRPGEILGHHTGTDVKQHKTELNAQMIMGIIDWIGTRTSDRVSGVTDVFRGQQQYAGQTATAVRDMLGQSNNRIAPQAALARDSMQDYYEIAITLNRLYLQPHQYFRVVEEQGAVAAQTDNSGRPVSAGDFIGVAGKDLVPTGFAGSMTAMTEETMNEAVLINNLGGNPQELLRQYFKRKYQGRVDVDSIFPANGVGNDPSQENELLLSGTPISRDPDDNDQNHIIKHMELLVDPRFQQMSFNNPTLPVVLQAHIGLHQEELSKLMGMMGGGVNGTGMVGVTGGSNRAQPKTDAARESQMSANGAGANG